MDLAFELKKQSLNHERARRENRRWSSQKGQCLQQSRSKLQRNEGRPFVPKYCYAGGWRELGEHWAPEKNPSWMNNQGMLGPKVCLELR